MPADPGKTATRGDESDLEPEAKKLKSVTTDDPCRPPEEQPCRPGPAKAQLVVGACEAKAQATTPALRGEGWQCAFCTYINNSVLPYCEVCENPRGGAGEYMEGDVRRVAVCLQITCVFRDNCCHQRPMTGLQLQRLSWRKSFA